MAVEKQETTHQNCNKLIKVLKISFVYGQVLVKVDGIIY